MLVAREESVKSIPWTRTIWNKKSRLSAHKLGMAVDIYDHGEHLDNWIDAKPDALVKYDLYREEPASTVNWLHLSTRKPLSGKRTFKP